MVGIFFQRFALTRIVYIILIIIFIVVATTAVFVTGVYKFGWDNLAAKSFVKIIPLPAALVGGKAISLAELDKQVEIYKNLVKFQSDYKFDSPQGKKELSDIRSSILSRSIENKIIADLAKKRGIVADQQKLSNYFQFLLAQFGVKEQEASREIKNLLGVSDQEFKELIVLPDLKRAELAITLLKEATQSDGYLQAKRVREELLAGLEFAEAAARYSDDGPSKFIGGDLGFVTREDLPPWLASQAFNLKEGDLSEIVFSPDGYHLLSVYGRDLEENRIGLRQILIEGPSFEDYLEKEKKNYKIYIWTRD